MPKFLATVLGFAYENPTKDFPARTGPGTTFDKTDYTITKGTADLPVLDIKADVNDTRSDFGRTYQWFHLQFPDGKTGWLRGHVVGIQGDFTDYGYGVVEQMTHAYKIDRDETKTGPAPLAQGQEMINPLSAAASGTEPTAPEATITTKIPEVTNPLAIAATDTELTEPETIISPTEVVTTSTEVTITSTEVTMTPTEVTTISTEETTTSIEVTMTSTEVTTTPTGVMTTPTEEVKPIVEKPATPPTAIIKAKGGITPRLGPSTVGYDKATFVLPTLARLQILDVVREQRAQRLRWYQVQYQGKTVWVREDFCRYEGDTDTLGLPSDVYPAPLGDKAWWVRDFNLKPDFDDSTWEHWGWDFGADTGTPMTCGPAGGTVVQVMDCTKCTPDRPSTVMNNLSLGDKSVLSDPGWGFGYGNFIVIGYKHDILPASTQAALAQKGYPGGALFVLYGHMQKRAVNSGDELKPNALIGGCGNTGNSEATHLHLEVRMSKSDKYPGWSSLGSKSLVSPVILFNR